MSKRDLIIYVVGSAIVIFGAYKFFSSPPDKQPVPPELAQLLESEKQTSPEASATVATASTAVAPTASGIQNKGTDFAKEPTMGMSDSDLISMYNSQILKNPRDGNSYYQLGLIYQKKGQYNAAIDNYTRAISVAPDSANALYNRGLCYEKRLEHDNAIKDYDAAIKIKGDDPRIYNARGLAQVEKKNLVAAESDYQKAITIDPGYSQAYFNRGTLYERQKKYKEAVEEYSKAIEFNKPDNDPTNDVDEITRKLESYYRRSMMYLALNQTDTALKDVNYVIQEDPQNPKAYRLRAAIYSKTGNSGAAATDEVTAQNLGLENMLQQGNDSTTTNTQTAPSSNITAPPITMPAAPSTVAPSTVAPSTDSTTNN